MFMTPTSAGPLARERHRDMMAWGLAGAYTWLPAR
jgi:hypothetical protein